MCAYNYRKNSYIHMEALRDFGALGARLVLLYVNASL